MKEQRAVCAGFRGGHVCALDSGHYGEHLCLCGIEITWDGPLGRCEFRSGDDLATNVRAKLREQT